MTKKLTQADLEKIANKRNHTLIALSNPENPRYNRKGTIDISCFCGHHFKTTVHNYLAAENGCPNCKSTNLKLNNPNKSKRLPLKIRKKKEIDPTSIFSTINSREELINFLKTNKNSYNDFLVEKIEALSKMDLPPKNQNNLVEHHIIPKHIGGPDTKWNLVKLSSEDHKKAHELRYEVYKDLGDEAALRLWNDPPKNTFEAQSQPSASTINS